MKIALYILFGIYLLILSVEDIRSKKIHIALLLSGAVLIPFFIFFVKETDMWNCLLGMFPGLILLIISIASKGGIGIADAVVVFILGANLGIGAVVTVLSAAFILITIFSGGLLIFGKLKMKSTLPFIPFVFVAFLVGVFFMGIV
ncbi:MAG: hypothetical protein IKP88_21475 [Lachnospiraceae bacterium]|nr:hypothetical protein [Lachnospiraceae bacterium]